MLCVGFIRNRLNVIGTSMYLLENVGESDPFSRQKYINKIKYELKSSENPLMNRLKPVYSVICEQYYGRN